jgi:hypothetical protein
LMTCLQVLAQELQSDSIRWFPARRVPQEVWWLRRNIMLRCVHVCKQLLLFLLSEHPS